MQKFGLHTGQGGTISLALNTKGDEAGQVGYSTYLALIGIKCLGLSISLLLSSPDKVRRSDGTKMRHLGGTTWKQELRGLWAVIRSRQILLLMPIFITGMWGTTYQSNYLTTYFSVRARALASFLTAIVSLAADVLTGYVLDQKQLSQAQQARFFWTVFAITVTGLWMW